MALAAYTCANLTLVNVLCNRFARFFALDPGLTGRSILGVLIRSLAVINISLKDDGVDNIYLLFI